MTRFARGLRAALAGALALLALAGCADRPSMGVQWALEQEEQRQRLEAQGFPQYVGSR
jgi:hypothetical protein